MDGYHGFRIKHKESYVRKHKTLWLLCSLLLCSLGLTVTAASMGEKPLVTVRMKSYEMGAAKPYEAIIVETAHKHNFEPELIAAVVNHEGCVRWTPNGKFCTFVNPNVRGLAGEYGLMQVKFDTCRMYFDTQTCSNLHDPRINIIVGTLYLRRMVDTRGGDIKWGLSGYNSGPNNPNFMTKYVERVMTNYTYFRDNRKYLEIK